MALSSNEPVFRQMVADPYYRQFAFELTNLLKRDPGYSLKRQAKILESCARGERIVQFDGSYVVNSSVPPVPSRAFTTFIQGGRNENRLLTDLAYARRSAPLSAHLGITARCNSPCKHCSATIPDRQSELTKDQWIQIIGDLQDAGVAYVAFSGAEPLLRPDIEDIVASVDDRSTTLLCTDGRGLSRQRAEALKRAGLFSLAVSIDSPNAKEHNRLRHNPCAFEDALRAIDCASEAGLYTLASAMVYRRQLTREHIVRLAKLVQRQGAHELRIHQPMPQGRLDESKEEESIFYNEDDVARLNEIQFALNSAGGEFPKISSVSYTEGPCKFGCGAGVLHSYISATGELWPCEFVPLSFGNVLREDFTEVYAQMVDAVGIPKNFCWARKLSGDLANRRLPLTRTESHSLARADRSSSYPQFFRDLQSVPIGVPPRNDVGTLAGNVYPTDPALQRRTPVLTT